LVVETVDFTGQMNKLDVSTSEHVAIYDVYSSNPEHGSIIRGTGSLRKGRIVKDDTGKSGGYRVFSFFANAVYPVVLLWIIDKTRDANLTDAQAAAFRQLTSQLKQECK
jgi:hypothetical protein